MSGIVRRPYQNDAIQAVIGAWPEHSSVLVVCPTGTGKSVIFSELAKYKSDKRILVLANRGELLFQAARHIQRAGLTTSIEKADLSAGTGMWDKKQVVVASVQSMISKMGIATRMHKFEPNEFGLVICDEAHLFVAKSFQSIINYFVNGNPEIKIFGCTATPSRSDEVALGQVFKHCAFRYEIADAINDGWLVPVTPLCLRVDGMDFSHISTSAGDLNSAELGAVMTAEKPLYGVAQATLEQVFCVEANSLHGVEVEQWGKFLIDNETAPRSALVFTVTVKHAELMCDILNRVVPNIAEWVCGKTPENQRAATNERFKNGRLPILVNCGTHTTGFDAPRADIIVPKPTKSHSLALQMFGRGFRPAEVDGRSIVDQYETAQERKDAIARSRKPKVTIIDLHGVTGKHKLITPFDILGGKLSPETVELAIKNSIERGRPVDMTEEMENARKELEKRIQEAKDREQSKRAKLVGKAKFRVSTTNMFDGSSSKPVQMLPRQGKVVSEGMARILKTCGIDPFSIPYERALQIVRNKIGEWKRRKPATKGAKKS